MKINASGPKRFSLTRRNALGGAVATTLIAPHAFAQAGAGAKRTIIAGRHDFDVEGGKYSSLENPAASEQLRNGAPVLIRFQLFERNRDNKYLSTLGFTVISEDGVRALQVSFYAWGVTNKLTMTPALVDRSGKGKREQFESRKPPKFKVDDVHEMTFAVEQEAVVAIMIGGERRSFRTPFQPYSLVANPSGVKGWVELGAPPAA